MCPARLRHSCCAFSHHQPGLVVLVGGHDHLREKESECDRATLVVHNNHNHNHNHSLFPRSTSSCFCSDHLTSLGCLSAQRTPALIVNYACCNHCSKQLKPAKIFHPTVAVNQQEVHVGLLGRLQIGFVGQVVKSKLWQRQQQGVSVLVW